MDVEVHGVHRLARCTVHLAGAGSYMHTRASRFVVARIIRTVQKQSAQAGLRVEGRENVAGIQMELAFARVHVSMHRMSRCTGRARAARTICIYHVRICVIVSL